MKLIFHWGGSDKVDRGLKQGALRLYYLNSPELFGGQRWPPWGSDFSSESWGWVAVGQGDRKTPTEMPTHAKIVGGATHWKDHQQAGVTEPRGRKRVLCRAMISRKEPDTLALWIGEDSGLRATRLNIENSWPGEWWARLCCRVNLSVVERTSWRIRVGSAGWVRSLLPQSWLEVTLALIGQWNLLLFSSLEDMPTTELIKSSEGWAGSIPIFQMGRPLEEILIRVFLYTTLVV